MKTWISGCALAIGALVCSAGTFSAGPARAQESPHVEADAGKRVYQRANCIGCHKWHGNGGGGYGGDALSLRRTRLNRDQMIMVVRCGRPGTGMPYHDRDAYDGAGCYGLTRETVGSHIPPTAASFLRPADIEAVIDYVLANIKSKGEPDYADCTAFFGTQSRMCHLYQTPASDQPPGATATGETPAAEQGPPK